ARPDEKAPGQHGRGGPGLPEGGRGAAYSLIGIRNRRPGTTCPKAGPRPPAPVPLEKRREETVTKKGGGGRMPPAPPFFKRPARRQALPPAGDSAGSLVLLGGVLGRRLVLDGVLRGRVLGAAAEEELLQAGLLGGGEDLLGLGPLLAAELADLALVHLDF